MLLSAIFLPSMAFDIVAYALFCRAQARRVTRNA